MIQENDNPFRPDGNLCHEVDPIVKKYATKPFPDSMDDDSPRKEDGTLTLVNGEQVQTVVEVEHKSLAPPKAGTLEMVHVEPRKKHCFCCSVQ
ncbi:hypothetical protein TTRE_0000294901 [Trichuris trichiura]|uniref:Uncharacterized protein n=1 Tax=Trichuris trichiura TaxID=36087 RepID=A0A077Z4E3_TRITR|nr:hypothetical protein TTRE_0000294901 [Trichuris trichiura]